MNLSTQLWEIYSQGKPEKVATPARRANFGRRAGTKTQRISFIIFFLVTWWQKEKGWPQKAQN